MPASKWAQCQECRIAIATWNFDAQSVHHLSLSVGDLVCVLEKCQGWYRGYLYLSPSKRGIFPSNYVASKDYEMVSAGNEDYPVPKIDPVALEATECLYHWKKQLYKLYSLGYRQKYMQILNYMEDVFHWRSNLTHSNVTHENLLDMRTKLTAKIDQINNMCSLPLSPRDTQGQPIDPFVTSVHDLYTTHKVRQDEVSRKVPQTGWDQKKFKEPTASKAYHLYLVVRNIEHHFPEDCEVFFFLFDSETKQRVSENFMINVKKSAGGSSPSRHYCIFSDLGEREMHRCSLFLVCQVVRKGKMLLDDKKHVASYPFRRPYAVGVLDLRQAVLEASSERSDDDDDDYQMTYLMSLQVCSTHEADFSTLHFSLTKKLGVKASGKQNITVSIAAKIIKGDLQKLRKDLAYMINKSTVTVDKLGFPDVIFPDDFRNDIYVTLEHGQFEKGNKTAPRNVEVAIAVCDSKGLIVPQCIVLAAGTRPLNEYESFIYYHLNQPRWHETFKLLIPPDKINVAHLRLGFRHVSKSEGKDKMEKTFAFSYIKLMKDDGSIIPDGTHELFVYKAEGKKWLDPSFYLKIQSAREVGGKLPSLKEKTSTRGKLSTINVEGVPYPGNQSISYSGKETVYISTLTCSTKLTQKVELVSLLNWRSVQPKQHKLPSILQNIKYVDGSEIVKFLPDTLNCLFDILADDSRTYGEQVFSALMSIFGIFSEDKFKHFIPVLDIYIENHFHAIAAHKDLLKFLNRWIQSINSNSDRQEDLLTVFNSLKFLMKFIIQSYILENSDYDDFRKILHNFYSSMCQLLDTQENYCRGIHTVQIALLRNLPAVLDDIAKMHNAARLAQVLAQVINSIQNVHPSVNAEKMKFIIAVLDSDINVLHTRDARKTLVPTLIGHLISYIDNRMITTQYRSDDDGHAHCLKAIGKMLKVLHSGESLKVDFADVEFVSKLFPNLVAICKDLLPGSNPLRVDALVNFIGLLRVMSDKHYSKYFNILRLNSDQQGHENDLKSCINDLLHIFNIIIHKPLFSKDWIVLYHIQSSTVLRALKNLSSSLFSSFFDDRSFIPSIWDTFFEVCVSFSTQSCLQLEQYPDLLKAKLIRQFGDIRSQMCKYIVEMWHRLAERKGNFIPNMIGPFLKISLLKVKEIRNVTIPTVLDFMKYEFNTSGNFKRVEMEVFDKMDYLVSHGKGDEEYRDLFGDILKSLCTKDKDIGETGIVFVDSVSRLIGLLLDYRNVHADASCKGQRMGCMFNLLNFYKEIEKEELYIRYVYKLSDLHERDSNFTEAGLTLLLHARTLEWSSEDTLPEEGKFPAQTACKRKEQLYHKAIELLNQGKNWEVGIPLCKDLAELYEKQRFDYMKLSEILRTQAEFFLKIITELRVEDEYFVVGYYGKGSPLFLRNKTFIHRGQPYERLQTFIKRLTDEFPSAKILMSADPPNAEMKNSNGLFLQVRKVIPIPEEHAINKELPIPEKIVEYYKTNQVSKFYYDRPFHKGKKDPECEFATLFIERSTFVTESSFPGVINAFEVNDTTLEKVNPLDMAIETVSSKIKEIQKVTSSLASNPSFNVNPLSMLLKGVIDAAVMGGIANYEKIFFQPKYIEDHPDHEEQVEQLRELIKNQVEVLREGLSLHCQRVPKNLQAFHCDLEERFEGFQEIVYPDRKKATKSSRSQSISRPLPPTPIPDTETKRLSRRPTGLKSHSTEKEGKLKRSLTTRQKSTEGGRLSIVSEVVPDQQNRLSTISTTSNHRESMTSSSSNYNDLPEDRGNYEMIDFDSSNHRPVLHNNAPPTSNAPPLPSHAPPTSNAPPPPSYAPPPIPPPESKEGHHNYFEIDFPIDDDDYQPVIPGLMQKDSKSNIGHKSEFADPKELFNRREKSPSNPSPPRRTSYIDKFIPRSSPSSSAPPQPHSPPPSPPGNAHLAPLSFSSSKTQKTPSPSHSNTSTSDSEPILEDLQSVRQRLLQQARESVIAETSCDNTRPLIDFSDTCKTDVQSSTTNQPSFSPQVQDDYWDHLETAKALKMRNPQKPTSNRDDIVSAYSLASEWRPDNNNTMPIIDVSGINSMYACVSEVTDGSVDGRKHIQVPPTKPAPYTKSPSRSPSKSPPTNEGPPPLPKKKSSRTGSIITTQSSSRPGQYVEFPGRSISIDNTPPPVVAKPRSFSKPQPNVPSSVPRKPFSSVSESPKDNVFVPPLPPKPVRPDMPPKPIKEAPFLPPKPARPPPPSKDTPPGVPPSLPPRPTKPPVPSRQ